MKYIRKTVDEYHVQGYYSPSIGWETVTIDETYAEAKQMLRDYRENECNITFRIKKCRVPIKNGGAK